jgi:hypothetical protein
MEGVVDFKVPLTVEIGEGANWAEAHWGLIIDANSDLDFDADFDFY